ncbi:MAG: HEAT repeat domain-containing protein [Candidatus Acidiferrales bacterium]
MKTLRIVLAAFALLAAGAVRAQNKPQIKNAQVETRAVSGGLDATVRGIAASQSSPAWIGYAVPMIEAKNGYHRSMCCGNWSSDGNNCGPCNLESLSGNNMNESDGPTRSGGTVHLEGSQTMFVLLRVADHRIGRVRAFTEDCQIDAGGLRVVWITDAKPAESVALLEGIVNSSNFDESDGRNAANGAMSAIVMHNDPAADRALAGFVEPSRPEKLRSQTAFWLGNARGKSGLDTLKRMAKSDPSEKVREQVTFALSQSSEPGAVDELIRMAKEDASSRVRGQGLFWLAQRAGQKAAGAITDAIENDPDTEVKKRAVFALSQMPKDEGVPRLIEVAKTNKNPAVRKQAMFWLGQSNDPRALAFFEQVLTH